VYHVILVPHARRGPPRMYPSQRKPWGYQGKSKLVKLRSVGCPINRANGGEGGAQKSLVLLEEAKPGRGGTPKGMKSGRKAKSRGPQTVGGAKGKKKGPEKVFARRKKKRRLPEAKGKGPGPFQRVTQRRRVEESTSRPRKSVHEETGRKNYEVEGNAKKKKEKGGGNEEYIKKFGGIKCRKCPRQSQGRGTFED